MRYGSGDGLFVLAVGISLGALGCGRIGFNLLSGTSDGTIDPGADASAPGGQAGASMGTGGASGGGVPSGGTTAGADASGGTTAGTGDSAAGGGAVDASTGLGGTSPSTDGAVTAGGSAGATEAGPPPTVETRVSGGYFFGCGTSGGGVLHCWGTNDTSALGQSTLAWSADPVPVGGEGDAGGFVELASGSSCTCARRLDGSVWCWGNNVHGQLGQGDTATRPTPVQVPLASPAVQISMQYDVACALLDDTSLWCWGENGEGQMAQDEAPPFVDAPDPIQIPGTGWTSVSAGHGHVCAVEGGRLWCWGRNGMSELGQGPAAPVQIRRPVQVGTDTNWRNAAASLNHTCAIKTDGSLWCWGENNSQQLGLGDGNPRDTPTRVGTGNDWLVVEASNLHACGIRSPGTLWCWGRNDEGQCGLPYDPIPIPIPTAIGSATDWTHVSSGWFDTCARRSNGSLWCTGENAEGQVGDGTTVRPYAFVELSPLP